MYKILGRFTTWMLTKRLEKKLDGNYSFEMYKTPYTPLAMGLIAPLLTFYKDDFDLTDKMKCSFFQAAVMLILLLRCTTWTLIKQLEKKLDGSYTRMLQAILNKSWQQHPTKHQLYDHLSPIMKTIQIRQTRHAGHNWRSRDKFISDVLLPMDPHIWLSKGRMTSSNIHTAAMWGYGMQPWGPARGDER